MPPASHSAQCSHSPSLTDLTLSVEQRVGLVHRPEHVVIVERLGGVLLCVQQDARGVTGHYTAGVRGPTAPCHNTWTQT